jgi:hypothetical protein
MKKIATSLIALALCAIVAAPALSANAVRISQVYGGGGGSTGLYLNDYIELFNASGSPVDISGWSLQYGSATGTGFGSTSGNMHVFPAGTVIQPCSYYLLQTGTTGTGGVAIPTTPDAVTTNINISATTGKVALINNGTGGNLCSGNILGGIYVDAVGFGTANCYETAVAPGIDNQSAAVRALNGLQDTDNNANDFTKVTGPIPHNSQSVSNPDCLVTPASAKTWGMIKTIYR